MQGMKNFHRSVFIGFRLRLFRRYPGQRSHTMLSKLNPKYHYWHFFVTVTALLITTLGIALIHQYLFVCQGSVPARVSKYFDQATWTAFVPSTQAFALKELWSLFINQAFFIAVAGFCLLPLAWERFNTFCKTKLSGYFDVENDPVVSFFFYLAYQAVVLMIVAPITIIWSVKCGFWTLMIRLTKILVARSTSSLAALVLIQVFSRRKITSITIIGAAYLILELYYNMATPGEFLEVHEKLENIAENAGIVAILGKIGFPLKRVAMQTDLINAHTSGWGSYAIIVIGTGLKAIGLSQKIIEGVVAHELGHWKYYHTTVHSIVAYLLEILKIFVLLYVIDRPSFYHAFGFKNTKESKTLPIGAGLILFDILFTQVNGLTAPLWNTMHWIKEFQADAFAAKLGYANEMIQFVQQVETQPLITTAVGLFYTDHPVFMDRVAALQKLV